MYPWTWLRRFPGRIHCVPLAFLASFFEVPMYTPQSSCGCTCKKIVMKEYKLVLLSFSWPHFFYFGINILTWLQGFQEKPLYLVVFSMYPSLFWELSDKRNLKHFQFWPKSHASILKRFKTCDELTWQLHKFWQFLFFVQENTVNHFSNQELLVQFNHKVTKP